MTMTTITPTQPGRERIDRELTDLEKGLQERHDQIRAAEALGDYTGADRLRDTLHPLATSTKTVLRLDMPGTDAWIEAELETYDCSYIVVAVVYHSAAWLDHERRDVTAQAAPNIWHYAEHYAALI
jgi:hypothetical protein